MKQVSQNLRNGIIDIEEVPVPGLKDNFVLVQNNFSIISSAPADASTQRKLFLPLFA